MFGRSIKTVPLFELFAHVIPVKSLFLDPVIDHIASLAVNFQGPLILDMGIETAFRFTPGTEEGLAMVHESSPHAGPLGPGGQNIHPHDLPISILDEKVAQNDLPLGRHKQEMLLPCLAVVLQHRARRLADERNIVLERGHAAGADPGNVRQSSP